MARVCAPARPPAQSQPTAETLLFSTPLCVCLFPFFHTAGSAAGPFPAPLAPCGAASAMGENPQRAGPEDVELSGEISNLGRQVWGYHALSAAWRISRSARLARRRR